MFKLPSEYSLNGRRFDLRVQTFLLKKIVER